MIIVHYVAFLLASTILLRASSHTCHDATAVIETLSSRCPTREGVDSCIENAAGLKEGFYNCLSKKFPGVAGLKDSGLRVNVTAKSCFLGDSIVREMHHNWQRMLPEGRAIYRSTACNHLTSDSPKYSKVQRRVARDRIAWMRDSKCDIIFVGGLGPHCLRREDSKNNEPGVLVPITIVEHKQRTEELFSELAKLSREVKVPIIFLGSPVVESDVLILDPPKGDWDHFHDFAMSKLRSFGEKESFDRIFGARGELFQDGFIRMLFLADWNLRCPGYRCDGMHSEIPVQRCPGNDGFLDIPLAEFLLSSGVLQALKNRGLYAKPCRHSEDSDGADPNCLVCNSTAPKYSTERTIYLKDL